MATWMTEPNDITRTRGQKIMVERRSELKRRQHRRQKMFKLKKRLATAKDGRDKDNVLKKIHVLSPWWKELHTSKA